jgi:N-formylglutamate amidohydrolase
VSPSFERFGPAEPASPIILSVPHGGRDYPLALRAALRVPLDALLPLEDRHIDQLALAARGAEMAFVARRARAWIDLNRAEHDRDPLLDDGASPMRSPSPSAKVKGGLGLVPRRIGGAGELWARRLSGDEVVARIEADHRPYHAGIAAALRAARLRFGTAVLLDIHSMPPITGESAARVVIGDRFGRSAGARFVSRVEGVVRDAGVAVALNAPYPGGHILDRHGAPARGLHAIQIEIDRRCYLDSALRERGPGFDDTVLLLRTIIAAIADELAPAAIAAE